MIGAGKGRPRAVEVRAFLDQVEARGPADLDVHLVLDNAATPKTKTLHDRLLKRPRGPLHFTPTSLIPSGAQPWLNLVETWFALLTRRRLQRGGFTRTADLEAAIHTCIDQTNAEPKPFTWTRSVDTILDSIGRFCRSISNSDH